MQPITTYCLDYCNSFQMDSLLPCLLPQLILNTRTRMILTKLKFKSLLSFSPNSPMASSHLRGKDNVITMDLNKVDLCYCSDLITSLYFPFAHDIPVTTVFVLYLFYNKHIPSCFNAVSLVLASVWNTLAPVLSALLTYFI